MAVLQVRKEQPSDEGRQRQMALLAFSAFSELKHVFLVDEDVDPFDMNDVLWAMNTRFQGDADIITIPGVRTHPLDRRTTPLCRLPFAITASQRRSSSTARCHTIKRTVSNARSS